MRTAISVNISALSKGGRDKLTALYSSYPALSSVSLEGALALSDSLEYLKSQPKKRVKKAIQKKRVKKEREKSVIKRALYLPQNSRAIGVIAEQSIDRRVLSLGSFFVVLPPENLGEVINLNRADDGAGNHPPRAGGTRLLLLLLLHLLWSLLGSLLALLLLLHGSLLGRLLELQRLNLRHEVG